MLTQGNEKSLGIIFQNSDPEQSVLDELQRLDQHPWYTDIIFFPHNLTCPNHLLWHKRRALRLKATKYCLTKDGLGWRNPNGLILRCVDEPESKKLMVEFHAGFCGGHFAARTIAHKILRAGYYWPNLFSDVHKSVRVSPSVSCSLESNKWKPFL